MIEHSENEDLLHLVPLFLELLFEVGPPSLILIADVVWYKLADLLSHSLDEGVWRLRVSHDLFDICTPIILIGLEVPRLGVYLFNVFHKIGD